jgi:hypothetical protein
MKRFHWAWGVIKKKMLFFAFETLSGMVCSGVLYRTSGRECKKIKEYNKYPKIVRDDFAIFSAPHNSTGYQVK